MARGARLHLTGADGAGNEALTDLKDILRRLAKAAVTELLDEGTTALAKAPRPSSVEKASQEPVGGLPQDQLMRILTDALKGGQAVSTNVKVAKFEWKCPRCGCRRDLAMVGGLNPAHLGHDGEFDEDAFRKSLVCPECGATSDSA